MKKGYWTIEKCEEEAKKFSSKKDFRYKYPGAYNACIKNGWLELLSHMISKKQNGYWTKERCEEEAKKFSSKKDFKSKSESAYNACLKNNWVDEVCSHMIVLRKKKGYWTKEKCNECSLLCSSRNEFYKKYNQAYKTCMFNGWLDDVCSHMKPIGNYMKRLVYVYEFEDNFSYIGLTCNIDKRNYKHLNCKSPVNSHINKTGFIPVLKILTDYIDLDSAIDMEKYYIKHYEKKGFNLLNRSRGGEIGSVSIIEWDYLSCKEESKKYKSRTEFRCKLRAYNLSKENGWLDEFYGEIKYGPSKMVLDYDMCKEESKKYKNRSDFRKNRKFYNYSSENDWLDDFFPKK